MKAVSPIVPGLELNEIKVAEHQDEYNTLPVLRTADRQGCISRWELTDDELETIKHTRCLYLVMLNFGQPLQPVQLSVRVPVTEVYG